jgi:hypothetical protein
MSKHTPGPWKVVTSWYDYSVEGPNGEEIIWQDGPYQTPTIKLSDARLIAAAPEMYELLGKIRGHIDSTCRECESKAIVPEIDALMDKIEGGRDAA